VTEVVIFLRGIFTAAPDDIIDFRSRLC